MATPLPSDDVPLLWELPAGLIEKDETGMEGIRACAARETFEETGLTVAPGDFVELGGPSFLSPGVIAEQLFFFSAAVDLSKRAEPPGDGSPVEDRAELILVGFDEALRLTADVKSELGIRRLMAQLQAEATS